MTDKQAIRQVEKELKRATTLHGPLANLHCAYAVILEELDELWDEVKKKRKKRKLKKVRDEASQVAAMAIRLMMDLT